MCHLWFPALKYVGKFLKKSLDSERSGKNKKNITPAKHIAMAMYIAITANKRGTFLLTNH
jgi:hypothetical protein